MGRENVKKNPKNKQNLLVFGGGEFPPLKALKKKHCLSTIYLLDVTAYDGSFIPSSYLHAESDQILKTMEAWQLTRPVVHDLQCRSILLNVYTCFPDNHPF